MFKSVFEVMSRTTLKVVKRKRVTKLLFPDDYTLESGDKVVCLEAPDGVVCLVKWQEGYPDKNIVNYNVGDNSINSAPIANYLRGLFSIDSEEFELITEVRVINDITILALVDVKINIIEEDTTEEVVATEPEKIIGNEVFNF